MALVRFEEKWLVQKVLHKWVRNLEEKYEQLCVLHWFRDLKVSAVSVPNKFVKFEQCTCAPHNFNWNSDELHTSTVCATRCSTKKYVEIPHPQSLQCAHTWLILRLTKLVATSKTVSVNILMMGIFEVCIPFKDWREVTHKSAASGILEKCPQLTLL